MGLWGFGLLVLTGALASSALEKHQHMKKLKCSEGLSSCRVDKEQFPVSENSGPVQVLGLDVKPVLCCKDGKKCKSCLLVTIWLRVLTEEESGETSGESDEEDDEDNAVVIMRYWSGPNTPVYWKISFRVTPNARENVENIQLTVVEDEGVFLGSDVNVTVRSFNRSVVFPSLREVCPSEDIEDCKTPRVSTVINPEQTQLRLMVVEDVSPSEPVQFCVKRWKNGQCWPSSSSIPLHTVTPCMCFQAWREGAPSRLEICPSITNTNEFRRNVVRNMSLSVSHSKTYDGHPVLKWNLSAPCRLEADVWLCRRGSGLVRCCTEVEDFRVHVHKSSQWRENSSTLWTSGEFVDFSSNKHFLHCVMLMVDGEIFGPYCEHDTHRGRWSIPVLIALVVLILIGVGVCVLRTRLRGCISDWEKTQHSGGSHGDILLLHGSGSDVLGAALVYVLGLKLSELGFEVCLDLDNQAELSSVGPGPWMHSKLNLLQKRGGKALLVLSSSALDMAQACWDSWTRAGERGTEEDRTSPYFSDVLGSALSCIFSSHLKGSAAERFILVQFDSQELISRDKVLPELFQGLQLYQLPSESHLLLTELCSERPANFSTRLKRLLWLRMASRRLTKSLKGFVKGGRPHAESVLTQEESLEEEKLPLHV